MNPSLLELPRCGGFDRGGVPRFQQKCHIRAGSGLSGLDVLGSDDGRVTINSDSADASCIPCPDHASARHYNLSQAD